MLPKVFGYVIASQPFQEVHAYRGLLTSLAKLLINVSIHQEDFDDVKATMIGDVIRACHNLARSEMCGQHAAQFSYLQL